MQTYQRRTPTRKIVFVIILYLMLHICIKCIIASVSLHSCVIRAKQILKKVCLQISLYSRVIAAEMSLVQDVPKNMGIQWRIWKSSLLWISIVIPNFKSHNIIMSARVYLMKRVKDCKDVSIMSLQDEQWIRTSLLCLYLVIFLFF